MILKSFKSKISAEVPLPQVRIYDKDALIPTSVFPVLGISDKLHLVLYDIRGRPLP